MVPQIAESLDDLESMTVELFSPFVNKKVQLQDNVNRPFEEEHWGRFFRVMPVSCHRSLTLLWQLPSPQPTYRSKGHRYLSHLLGHEVCTCSANLTGRDHISPSPSPPPITNHHHIHHQSPITITYTTTNTCTIVCTITITYTRAAALGSLFCLRVTAFPLPP